MTQPRDLAALNSLRCSLAVLVSLRGLNSIVVSRCVSHGPTPPCFLYMTSRLKVAFTFPRLPRRMKWPALQAQRLSLILWLLRRRTLIDAAVMLTTKNSTLLTLIPSLQPRLPVDCVFMIHRFRLVWRLDLAVRCTLLDCKGCNLAVG